MSGSMSFASLRRTTLRNSFDALAAKGLIRHSEDEDTTGRDGFVGKPRRLRLRFLLP